MATSRQARPRAAKAGQKRPVQITRYPRYASVAPPLAVLHEHLQVGIRRWDPNGNGPAWTVSKCLFFDESADDMVVPSGAVPRLVRLLTELGYEVVVDDQREQVSEIAAAIRANQQKYPSEAALADLMLRERSGLIEVGHTRQALETVSMAAALVSPVSVLIVVTDRAQVDRWQRAVGFQLQEEVQQLLPSRQTNSARIQICTYASFLVSEIWRRYMVLVPDAASAADAKSFEIGWNPLAHCPIYGIADKCRHLDLLTELRMEERFGAIISSPIAYTPTLDLKTVAFCDSIEIPGRFSSDPLEFKRQAIWSNDRRNQHVAAVALALANRESGRLWELGWRATEATLAAAQQRIGVAVLVEGLEHARQFQRLLPGWIVVSGPVVRPEMFRDHPGCFNGVTTPGFILTYRALDTLSDLPADVIVRADAGSGGLNPEQLMTACRWNGYRRRITIIDFTESEDRQLRKNLRARLRAYRSGGYSIEGAAMDLDRPAAKVPEVGGI